MRRRDQLQTRSGKPWQTAVQGLRRGTILRTLISNVRRYYITDRSMLGGVESLLEIVARQLAEGMDMIQIREKDLATGPLMKLVSHALTLPNPQATKILVNSRTDVALACGAHGVHLPSHSIAPSRVRGLAPPGFLIGVSCHELDEVRAAEREGADFVVYGPIFNPLSKTISSPLKGLDSLREACHAVQLPVYALGGIDTANAPLCIKAGAAGIAGITLFQR